MTSLYQVKTGEFEGPLELLLDLIEKRKLFINEISLAKIADDYVEYVKSMDKKSMRDVANFILVASTLVLIKSKSLLPNLNLTDDEKESIDDLEERLRVYQKMKEVSILVGKNFGKTYLFGRKMSKNIKPIFSPHNTITTDRVASLMQDVIFNLPKKEIVPEAIVRKVVSLEETIENLATRIQEGIRTTFKDFSGVGEKERAYVVVNFLALLELIKQESILVTQEANFSDIHMESPNTELPRYNL